MLKLLNNAYKAFKWIGNTEEVHFTHFTTEEERRLCHICINLIGDAAFDHVSIAWRDGVVTVYLFRDEIMNDDLISKIQDELYSKNCDVKIVYNWKSN